MKNLKNLSNCLTMIKSQGFEAEHILLVQLFGCIEAYWSLSGKEVFEEPVFVPIQGLEEKVGYNDLSNVNQEDILRSDTQSENVIDTVKSDPGDHQDVEASFSLQHLSDVRSDKNNEGTDVTSEE